MAKTGTKGLKVERAIEPDGRRRPAWDLALLLKPISRKEPAGESLRYEGTYDAVRDARTEEDENLPRGIWQTSTRKRADWAKVEKLCLDAIGKCSKDLQLAIWLTEAAFMRRGLGGLADGLALMSGLIENFWDVLHPEMPDDEPEFRAGPIQWLSDHMAVRLRLMPLNLGRGDDVPIFCLADWQRAKQEVSEDGGGEGDEGERAYRSRPEMQLAAVADPPRHYRDLVLDTDEVGQRLDDLVTLIDAHFEAVDAPGLHAMREVLADIRRFGMRILEKQNASDLLSDQANGDDRDDAVLETEEASAKQQPNSRGGRSVARKAKPAAKAAAAAPGAAGGPIRSRNEAYQRLEEAAAWLMENEPHSPTPYLIRRAVSWRDKSLVELLSELVPDDGYRGFLQSFFGAGGRSSAAEHYDDDDDEYDNETEDSDREH